jgi:chromosome partitioning protein
LPLFVASVRRAVAFQKAALSGCVVGEVKDRHALDAWGDYRAVGGELAT